jgi:2-iminobutanoate/2-iminopropanoate deaminase
MSTHQVVSSPDAPSAVGPYSQGINTGSFVFLAGQIPLVGTTGKFAPGDITAQTEQVITNIKLLLASQGLDLSNVVKSTVFLINLQSDFVPMNEIYKKHFTAPYPARSTVQVAALPLGALVEIEVIAAVKP